MSVVRLLWWGLGLSFALAADGCTDDLKKDGNPEPTECTPGTVYSCFRGGCKGTQTCSSAGVMSRCTCEPQPNDEDSGAPVDASAVDASEPPDAAEPPPDASEPPPAEQCDNDRDDDGDGDTDCADSACDDRSCERAPATDFKGPIALRTSEAGLPACDGAFGEEVFEAGESPSAAAASCSACACTPASAACAPAVDFDFSTDACATTACGASTNQACTTLAPACIAGLASVHLKTKLPAGASGCTASAQDPNLPELSWARRVVGCASRPAARGGCEQDRLCLPETSGDQKLCVWRDGEHACPAQQYTDRRVYYRDAQDTRTCSPCACSGPNCSYTWSVFQANDATCANPPVLTLTSADQCVQVNPSNGTLWVGGIVAGDGVCAPSGGASQGSVSGRDAVTVCCRP